MTIEAANNFIYILVDETEKERSGFLIPGKGQERQSIGTIISIGFLTKDPLIKKAKNKKAKYFKGTGFETEIEGTTYLVLTDDQIIGVEK